MGKAFVAKLAKEGARDPEALAAWIGRKKHGRQAFAKLAAKSRKKSADESPEVRSARARVEAAEQRAATARESADRANQSASDAYGRFAGGQKILAGHHSERSALRDRAQADGQTRRAISATETANRAEADVRTAQADAQGAELRAARSRPWGQGDFQAGDTVQIDRAGRPGESYRVVRANAKSVTVSRGHAGMDNKSIPYDKILSRIRDGETSSDPGAGAEATARPSLPSPEEQRAAGIASIAAANTRAAEQARQEAAERRQRNVQALERINSAPGKPTRKAMTPEERRIVNYEASGAALQVDNYERLRPFADESAQTNRVDVLKSRAFQKARAQRIKNGWSVPGEDSPTTTPATPAAPARVDPVAEARERNRRAAQERARRRR